MIRHYLKVASRNLFANKLFSFINVLSLSVGLAGFFLFLLYWVNETSYDRFNTQRASVYRMYEWYTDQQSGDAGLYLPLGPALKSAFPDVETVVRVANGDKAYLRYGDKQMRVLATYADPAVFDLFEIPLQYGSPSTALSQTNGVVLTRANAMALFGNGDPLGKIIEINTGGSSGAFEVTGVSDDPPSPSCVPFEMLLNLASFEGTPNGKAASVSWSYSGYQDFVRLREGSDLARHPERLVSFRAQYFPDEQAQWITDKKWDGKGLPPTTFRFQPLTDIHTNASIVFGGALPIDRSALWILLLIASGILIIGCVNFTTLSIGRSSKRGMEIGVRKVLGGRKGALMIQFLAESLLLSVLSGALALGLVWLFLPAFNGMMGVHLGFSLFYYQGLSWLFVGVLLASGLLAGMYPSGVLANLGVIAVLRNQVKLSGSNFFTRGLVTTQYVLSIGLIIATVVIFQQLHYMRSMDIGFNKENVVLIDASGVNNVKVFPLFKQRLLGYQQVMGVGGARGTFGENFSTSGFSYHGQHQSIMRFSCDADFASVLGMRLLSGRFLDAHHLSDTVNSVIVNEAFVRSLGLSNQSVLGFKADGYSRSAATDPVVVGVVKDYNLLPVKESIAPVLFGALKKSPPDCFYVRLRPGATLSGITAIRQAWVQSTDDALFDFKFLDDSLNARYALEERLGQVVIWAAMIAIFLATLGLGGLAFLSVENRTKELVIRKIFGGTGADILILVTKDFVRLVAIAFVVATPVAWYFLHGWLEQYAYRIRISAWVFVLTGVGATLFTFLTLSVTIVRVVFLRPGRFLRAE